MSEIIQVNPLVFGGEGESVHANMLTKLWENPNPTASFAAQSITLASDDYDFLLILASNDVTWSDKTITSYIVQKGQHANIDLAVQTGSSFVNTFVRKLLYVSDTSYSVQDNYVQPSNSTRTAYNNGLVPIAVYGFKKSLDITAIVSNVSTDARQCMLSDGVTSVESVLSGGAVRFQNDSQSYTMPAIGANVDVIKAVTPPSGYSLIGVINATAATGRCAVNAYVYNGQAALEIVNVNSTAAGTSKTATWTNVFVKN